MNTLRMLSTVKMNNKTWPSHASQRGLS